MAENHTIEGLPEGAIVRPISGQVEGLPEGAVVRPIGQSNREGYLDQQNQLIDKMQREAEEPQLFSKGGFIQRGLSALGVPTTWGEVESQQPKTIGEAIKTGAEKGILGPVGDLAWNTGKGLVEAGKGAIREGAEAGRNIAEGGDIWQNVRKAASGAVEHGIEALPFVGPQAAQVGRDIATGNWGGAAGGAMGTILPFATPAIGEGAARLSRTTAIPVAESALGVTDKGRMFGKTPGEFALTETKGLKPANVLKSTREVMTNLGQNLERAYQDAAAQGKTASLQPAIDILDREINAAKTGQNKGLLDALLAKKERLTLDLNTGGQLSPNQPPERVWKIKTNWGDDTTWNENVTPKIRDRINKQVYGALDKELDTAAPEVDKLNQRYSSAVETARRANIESRKAGIVQSSLGRIARQTGGAAAGAYELLRGNVPGAVAAIAGPEILANPTVKMAGARALWGLGGGERLPMTPIPPALPPPPAPPPQRMPMAPQPVPPAGMGGPQPIPGPTPQHFSWANVMGQPMVPPVAAMGSLPAIGTTTLAGVPFEPNIPIGPIALPHSNVFSGVGSEAAFEPTWETTAGSEPTSPEARRRGFHTERVPEGLKTGGYVRGEPGEYPPYTATYVGQQPPRPGPVVDTTATTVRPELPPKPVGPPVAEKPVMPTVTEATGNPAKPAPIVPPEPAPMPAAPPPVAPRPAAPLVQEQGPMPTAKAAPPPPPPEAPPMVPKVGEPEPRPTPPAGEAPKPVSEKPETTPTEKGNTDMRETPTEAPKKPTGPYVPGPEPIKPDLRVDKEMRLEVTELLKRHPDLSREEALDIIREVRRPATTTSKNEK